MRMDGKTEPGRRWARVRGGIKERWMMGHGVKDGSTCRSQAVSDGKEANHGCMFMKGGD